MENKEKTKITDSQLQAFLEEACGNLLVFKALHPEIPQAKLAKFLSKNTNALIAAKSCILERAEQTLLQNLNSENDAVRQRAAEFILKQKSGSEYQGQAAIAQQIVISDAEKMVQIKNIFGQ